MTKCRPGTFLMARAAANSLKTTISCRSPCLLATALPGKMGLDARKTWGCSPSNLGGAAT